MRNLLLKGESIVFLLLTILGFQTILAQHSDHILLPSKLSLNNVQVLPVVDKQKHMQKISELSGTWLSIAEPETTRVAECSIGGDDSRLVVFYRELHPELNQDWGILKEWNGSEWTLVTNSTLECHSPDVAVKGSLVVMGWTDDGTDYGFCSNVNGPWVSLSSVMLTHSYGARVTIAQDRGYLTYAARYSDGMPSSYLMLHIHSPLGAGEAAELNGGWTEPFYDVGMYPDIAGDENFWISASTQIGGVAVKKGAVSGSTSSITDLGEIFHVAGTAGRPCVSIRNNVPVALWTEGELDTLFAAEWNETDWMLIGQGALEGESYFASVRAASAGSLLYAAYNVYDGENYTLTVDRWDGESWTTLNGIIRSSGTSYVNTLDISIYQGNPVIAFTEDGAIRVQVYSSSVSVNETPPVDHYSLSQNYPNPFNPDTKISYTLPENGHVILKVYDALGKEVQTLVKEQKNAGSYQITFDGSALPSGVYFYKITAGRYSAVRKMLILK